MIVIGILTIVLLIYLLMLMPKMRHRQDITPFQSYHYAHRGLHQKKDKSPENSLVAFQLAVEKRFGIELDVQLSKDAIPVVFHDYSLKRICNLDKKVKELTFEELKELHLYKSKQRIPSLKEVLDLVDASVPLIVELKVEGMDTCVCEVVDSLLQQYDGVYCIESFNPLVLLWYKKNRPNVVRGQLSSNLIKDKEPGDRGLYLLLQNLLLNFITKPDFIAYNYKHRKMLSYILCHKFYKIPTFAWTIKSQEILDENRNSFDFFIFEKFIPKENS